MPQKGNTTQNTTRKAFNPTLTALFENEKFGEGALLSVPIDNIGYENAQKYFKMGAKLLIRKAAKPNKNGGATYYAEILAPRNTVTQTNDEI